jgi:hypothetical protein
MSYKRLGQIPIEDILQQLQEKNPDLYAEVKSRGTRRGKVHLTQALAQKLDNWLVAEEIKNYRDPFNDEISALAISESKRLRNEREAQARFDYWRSQGLIDNEANASAITRFITEHAVLKGKLTAQAVDVAIDFLSAKGSNVLQWQQKIAAPPPAPAPKPWKAGDPLPDEATEYQLRHSSVAEIKAWKRHKQI